ncbi:hypothetical protein DEJ33_00140 [Curtobacterium sp. MCPF17_047]|uniref:MarR family transcriptional regulator n=1 Tax=unclassified Curtobacterium TaxID=257496 RepID=UPI000DA9A87E|nr:hypothetical protein DEJ24_01125 [Curtobacterium sp. MCPF17_001]PZF68830.1 hypothetical protein DEJ33_00140 [Curtobacterium sp. MCPF17_047]
MLRTRNGLHPGHQLGFRTSCAIRPTDAVALLHLVEASRGDRFLSPTELAAKLHLTSAGVTKLVDRLSSAARVERRPNPRERRSVALVPTATATAT